MKLTNMERYRAEIEKVDYNFAVSDGEVKRCRDVHCDECDLLNIDRCMDNKIKWLMSECVEPEEPMVTAREKHFVEFLKYGWIARDECGRAYWFKRKPKKLEDIWDYHDCTMMVSGEPFEGMFEFVKWEDAEPWAVEDIRKLKVKLEYHPDDVAFNGGGVE